MEELLKAYGLPGAVIAVMGWLVKTVTADAQADRRACAEERQTFLRSLNEHSIRDAEALDSIKDALARIAERLPTGP